MPCDCWRMPVIKSWLLSRGCRGWWGNPMKEGISVDHHWSVIDHHWLLIIIFHHWWGNPMEVGISVGHHWSVFDHHFSSLSFSDQLTIIGGVIQHANWYGLIFHHYASREQVLITPPHPIASRNPIKDGTRSSQRKKKGEEHLKNMFSSGIGCSARTKNTQTEESRHPQTIAWNIKFRCCWCIKRDPW